MSSVLLVNCLGGGGETPEVFSDVVENTTNFSITQDDLKDISQIKNYAFYGSNIQSIDIPSSVTSIGEKSFGNCDSLTTITMTSNDTYEAISNCILNRNTNQLVKACRGSSIPNTVTSIGDYAFFDCKWLTSIVLPDNINGVSSHAFEGCSNLTFIKGSENSVYSVINSLSLDGAYNIELTSTSLSSAKFQNKTSIKSIVFPSGISSIAQYCFYKTGITSVDLSERTNPITIGSSAFGECVDLNTITIPDYISGDSINSYAFNGNTIRVANIHSSHLSVIPKNALTTLNVVGGTSIGNSAITYNNSLTSVSLVNTITNIGNYAFNNDNNITTFNFKGTPEEWCSVSLGNETSNPSYYAHNIEFNGVSSTSLAIGNSATSVGSYAFINCSDLTSILLPNTLTSIGISSFQGCSGITSISIPSSVTAIYGYAFKNCTGLTSIALSQLSTIGEGMLSGDSNLTSISLYRVGGNYPLGFYFGTDKYDESRYTSQHAGSSTYGYYIPTSLSTVNVLYGTVSSVGTYAFENCHDIKTVNIAENITLIDSNAFRNCSYIETVSLPTTLTTIGTYAFYSCSKLKNIDIPNSVRTIGNYAFYSCNKLDRINIPSGVTSIGTQTFSYCTGVASVDIPDTVTTINSAAFRYDTKLLSVTLGSNVSTIQSNAFESCPKLIEVYNKSPLYLSPGSSSYGYVAYYAKNVYTTPGGSKLSTDGDGLVYYTDNYDKYVVDYQGSSPTVSIPNSVTQIYQYALYNNEVVEEITIPNGITSIPTYAFSGCTNLNTVTLPNSLRYINDRAFASCNKLSSITLSNTLTSIGMRAFNECTNLSSIIIPDSINQIGDYAFNHSGLTTISLPTSINNLSGTAFNSCINIQNIYYRGTLDQWLSSRLSSVLNSSLVSQNLYIDNQLVENLVIPTNISTITSYAFKNVGSLKTLIVTNDATSLVINSNAFNGCSELNTVDIEGRVTSIGLNAFANCQSINVLTLPNTLTAIDAYAFDGSSINEIRFNGTINEWATINFGNSNAELTSASPVTASESRNITFSDSSDLVGAIALSSLTHTGNGAFSYCSNITSVSLPSTLKVISDGTFAWCTKLASINIPNQVTYIGPDTFSQCKLTSIDLGSELKDLGGSAFHSCAELSSIVFGDALETIGNYAFSGCEGLTSVTLGNSVREANSGAFYGCFNLKSITIPISLRRLGRDAFSTDSGVKLEHIYYGGTISNWNSISKGNTITKPTIHCIDGLITSSSTTWYASEDLVYTLDSDHYEVSVGTTSELTVNVPPTYNDMNVTEVATSGFANSNIVSITLPDGITTIGDSAFENCSSLDILHMPSSVVSIGDYALHNDIALSMIYYSGTISNWTNISFGTDWDSNTGNYTVWCSDGRITKASVTSYYPPYNLTYTLNDSKTGFILNNANSSNPTIHLQIPSTYGGLPIVEIKASAFSSWTSTISAEIPDTVTIMGSSVFSRCSNLTSLKLSNGLTSIGGYFCSQCTSLPSVVIPDTVTIIGDQAFYGCTSLASVTIGSGVTDIYSSAFYNCSSLTSITYNGTMSDWNNINLGVGWNYNTGNYIIHCTDGDIPKS